MAVAGGGTGTVESGMDTSDENPDTGTDATGTSPNGPGDPRPHEASTDDPATATAPDAARGSQRARGLDRRTVAVCVCIALVGAMVAGLVVSAVASDDDTDATASGQPGVTLQPVRDIDPDDLAGVKLLTIDGAETRLSELAGDKVTVVNLWAQSCAPCIKEMPWLEQTSHDNPDVAFLGVNVLDRLDNAKAMAAKTAITYPWVRDPRGDFANVAQSIGLPDTLLIDTDGTVLASKLGAFESQAEIQAWLDEHVR